MPSIRSTMLLSCWRDFVPMELPPCGGRSISPRRLAEGVSYSSARLRALSSKPSSISDKPVNRSSRSCLSSVGDPRRWFVTAALVAAAGCLGLGIGYALWGSGSDWYHQRDVSRLPSSPENDLVRYGWQLIADMAAHIGRSAVDPRLRYAGNDLACTNCHMNSGVKAFAAPFVSTFTSFPMMVDDRVLTLAQRINGCMTRSMNGRKLSEGSREMDAIVAYIRFVGTDSPQGVRVAGMGLWHMHPAEQAPDIGRGEQFYTLQCASCHKPDG